MLRHMLGSSVEHLVVSMPPTAGFVTRLARKPAPQLAGIARIWLAQHLELEVAQEERKACML